MSKLSLYQFDQLDNRLLYRILQLRSAVFVLEQQSIYQDLDDEDQGALHAIIWNGDNIAAYARIIERPHQRVHFGRVLTEAQFRGQGIGKELLQELILFLKANYPGWTLEIVAQSYLLDFYQHYGLQPIGEHFILDGIQHIHMSKTL